MKRVFLLILALAAALSLLLSCEQPTEVDLSGILRFRDDLSPEDWNEGCDDYYNEMWYSFVNLASGGWLSEEDASSNFAVVSWADEDSAEYAAHPQFLRVEQGYGYGKWVWHIYDVDPESGQDNGFVAGDTVDVSIDVWVPDMSGLPAVAWIDILAVGKPYDQITVPGDPWNPTFTIPPDRMVKYDSDPGTPDETSGSGGWITLTSTGITVSDAGGGVGVVCIFVKMGNQNPDATFLAFFDNLEVTKQ